MRRLIVGVALFAFVPGPVLAAEVERGGQPSSVVVRDSRPGDVEDEPVHRVGVRRERFYYRVLLWNAEDGFCFGRRSTTDRAYAERQDRIGRGLRFRPENRRVVPDCQYRATPAPELQVVAAQVWERVEDLPVPALDIEPDHAVTGKKVYLQIAGPTTWTKAIDNPIGDDIVISATSHYVIDWGDPTWDEKTVTRSQGGPWPDGDVTHVYTEMAERRTIRVTQRWKANWSAGDRGGTLSQLTTQAPALHLEVRQLQAVRNR